MKNTTQSSIGLTSTDQVDNSQSTLEQSNQNEAIKWEVLGTPFEMVKVEQGIFLAWNEYRLTEPFETEEELDKYAEENYYIVVGNFMGAMIQKWEKVKAKRIEDELTATGLKQMRERDEGQYINE